MKSYKDLEIYKSSFQLAKKIHLISHELPKSELYELGSQLRRSAQSIRANIAEGYGRRKYKNEFIRYLMFSNASLLETESHLEMIKTLYKIGGIEQLINDYQKLGKQLSAFIKYVENDWKTTKN